MNIEDIIEFLIDFTGKTGEIADKVLTGKSNQIKGSFFNPMNPNNPKKDAGLRAVTIITVPIAASILSVAYSLTAIFLAFKSLYDLSVDGKDEALETLGQSGTMLLGSTVALLVAVIGPLVNLIDLIGSGINSLSSADESADVPHSTDAYTPNHGYGYQGE